MPLAPVPPRLLAHCRRALSIMCWLGALFALSFLAFGVYFRLKVQHYVNLMDDYDHHFAYYMLALGGFQLAFSLAGGVITWFEEPRRRIGAQLNRMMIGYSVLCGVVAVGLLAAAILCFTHTATLRESFSLGLRDAMSHYRLNAHLKREVDELQAGYRCCGSDEYADWFKTSWVDLKYLNAEDEGIKSKIISGRYINDDVPFSCCDTSAARPCIHHSVTKNYLHHNYDHKQDLTIYRRGCKPTLLTFFKDDILVAIGVYVFVTLIFELLKIILIVTTQIEFDNYLLGGANSEKKHHHSSHDVCRHSFSERRKSHDRDSRRKSHDLSHLHASQSGRRHSRIDDDHHHSPAGGRRLSRAHDDHSPSSRRRQSSAYEHLQVLASRRASHGARRASYTHPAPPTDNDDEDESSTGEEQSLLRQDPSDDVYDGIDESAMSPPAYENAAYESDPDQPPLTPPPPPPPPPPPLPGGAARHGGAGGGARRSSRHHERSALTDYQHVNLEQKPSWL